MPIDWSSLWKKDDWWSVWIGIFIVLLVVTSIVVKLPKVHSWSLNVGVTEADIPLFFTLGLGILVLTSIEVKLTEPKELKDYAVGFPLLFLLAFIAQLISKQETVNTFGLAYAIWGLLFGLLISNTVGAPKLLKKAAKTELFIKIGLVVLGAEILFSTILKAGGLGLFEVTIGLSIVWYFCYLLGLKIGLKKSLSAVMATATSVCGVSAAIASSGAIKGDPKELSYVVSLVLLFSAPMIFLMPIVGHIFGIPEVVFGAWVGGTIDNTASVVASGSLYSEQAMQIASVIKLSQNILIGIVAFLLALYWVFKVEKKDSQEKPKPIQIWYRFPKFILGFLMTSILFSLVLTPILGLSAVNVFSTLTKEFRGWFFALTFVSIGLNTRFSDFKKIGLKKPLFVFLMATIVDIILSLVTAYVFFSGTFFPSPI